MKVIILGASGLVGSQVLKQAINDERVIEVVCFVRSRIEISNNKLRQVDVDFEQLDKWENQFNADCLLCCLGTTIKKAGSESAFRKVDFDYIVKSAYLFSKNSKGKFIFISSLGADENSSIFYNKVKGETENKVKSLGINRSVIIRPSLLLGDREETRPMESIGKFLVKPLNNLLHGSLKKYRGVEASEVARVMLAEALGDKYESFIEVERA